MKTLIRRFDIGEFQGFVLYDNDQYQSANDVVAHPNLEQLKQLTHEYDFELNKIPVGYNNLLIRGLGHTILVDAGIRRPMGNLCKGLRAINIDPSDIDTIVFTHTDMDHVGGILDPDGELSYPNARYLMLEDSWGYWSSKKKRSELTKLNKWTNDKTHLIWETLSKVQDLIIVTKAGEEFIPGFRLFPAPGHRIDHSILKITSLDEHLMHISDALIHPLFMGNRAWYSTYDSDPVQAVETKTNLLNICASEKSLLFGAHFPFPGLGTVQIMDECWKWQPLAPINVEMVASEIDAEINALQLKNTPNVRKIRRKYSQLLKSACPDHIFEIVATLISDYGYRDPAYELLANHPSTFEAIGEAEVEALGQGINSWWSVDSFARLLAGPAWMEGQIPDALIARWAKSPDLWWRRAALVSTVALNVRSHGGRGDVPRTLAICRLLADDHEDMVVKALSWALRELVVHDPTAVEAFIQKYEGVLAALVKREVKNKLVTGLKNPRRAKGI